MKLKTSTIIFLISGIISIFLILNTISCFPAATDKIDVTPPPELEEVYDPVDYENANVDAEISGYIPSFLCTDSDNYIKIEIKNTSDFTWRAGGENRVRISYHYYGQDVENNSYENNRTVLPNNLEPGESATVEVLINAITEKGTYILQIDPVLEGYFYFSQKEIPMLQGKVYFSSCID